MKRESVDNTSPWPRATWIIAAILILAFGLRVWGVWFGLPHIFHNDEGNEVLRALQLGLGQFNFSRIDKGVYFYLLFVEYGILFVVLKLAGIIESAVEFGEYFVRDPSVFYLIGRTTTAFIGTATVFLIYRVGRIAYGTQAALIAAGALTLNILHAKLSHYVTVDVPLTFFSIAALYFAVKMIETEGAKNYWLAAALAGLATATKTPGVLLLIPLMTAHVLSVLKKRGQYRRFFLNKLLWQAVAIFIGTYVITNPGIVVHFDTMFMRYVGKFIGNDASTPHIVDTIFDGRSFFERTNLFRYYADVVIDSMGLAVFLICLAGMAHAFMRRSAADVVFLSFIVPTYLVLAMSNDPFQFFPRYMLPVLPVFILLGGQFVSVMLTKIPTNMRVVSIVVVAAACSASPFSRIVAANHLMTQADTRAIARAWVDANISSGSKIFIEGSTTEPIQGTVPLQNSAENLRESIAFFRDAAPGKARYFRMALKAQSGPTFDLLTVQPKELKTLRYYKEQGVRYFVVRPESYPGSRVRFHWPELVENLRNAPDVSLVQRFEPDMTSRPGPLIEVYRVNRGTGAN